VVYLGLYKILRLLELSWHKFILGCLISLSEILLLLCCRKRILIKLRLSLWSRTSFYKRLLSNFVFFLFASFFYYFCIFSLKSLSFLISASFFFCINCLKFFTFFFNLNSSISSSSFFFFRASSFFYFCSSICCNKFC